MHLHILLVLAGNTDRTIEQKFDCVNREYLMGFSKRTSTLDSRIACSRLDATEEGIKRGCNLDETQLS